MGVVIFFHHSLLSHSAREAMRLVLLDFFLRLFIRTDYFEINFENTSSPFKIFFSKELYQVNLANNKGSKLG